MKKMPEMAKDILIGTAIGYGMTITANAHQHRDMSHRAWEPRPILRETLRMITWAGFGSDSRKFAANHLRHHKYAGTRKDPHPTELIGVPKVFFGSTYLNSRASRALPSHLKDEVVFKHRGDKDDPAFTRNQEGEIILKPHILDPLLNRSWLGIAAGTGILATKFGIKRGARIMATSLAYDLMVVGTDNALAHKYGEHPEPNPGTNMGTVAAVLTGGEAGGHNHHHAHPEDIHNTVEGRPDPTLAAIKVLCRLGLGELR